MSILCLCSTITAQTDSTKSPSDTIRIGGMIIVKKGNNNDHRTDTRENRRNQHLNINTSELIIDLGFANWTDNTDYSAATNRQYLLNRPGQPSLSSNDLKLKTGKSSNVNIWFFMQRLNLVKHYVSLKYGIGLEMNNYRFNSSVSFKESSPNPYATSTIIPHPYIFRDSISFSKNKLSADYATVPFMINFRSNPNNDKKGISFSAGVSVGYLYSTRNKQVSSDRGKQKNHGDYDLEKWKFSYIGELGLGPARLYGSYVPASIFQNAFSIIPYTIGVRFSNW